MSPPRLADDHDFASAARTVNVNDDAAAGEVDIFAEGTSAVSHMAKTDLTGYERHMHDKYDAVRFSPKKEVFQEAVWGGLAP